MRLNKSTNDAIQILLECARSETELVKVADLSERLGITMQNVFKIVHLLSRGRLVSPVRGRYGGVRLSRPADQIRIGEVVKAMEATESDQADSKAQRGGTAVSRVVDSAMIAFIEVLDRHTLADMVAGSPSAKRGGGPKRNKATRREKLGGPAKTARNAASSD